MRQEKNIVRLAQYIMRKRNQPMQFTKFARHVAHIYYARKDITKKNQKSVEGVLVDARQAGKFKTVRNGNHAYWGLPDWPTSKFGSIQTNIPEQPKPMSQQPAIRAVQAEPRREVHVRCPCCDADVTVSWTPHN